jgi:predicted ATPase/class 3 adenylate cyclase
MGVRSDLPIGTVTLVFTDVEGSTSLLHALGDRYVDVLADHRRLLRDAFRARGGVEVDTQGDAFFYAFASAGDAVRAAADAQRALAGHAWPDGHEVRVRMGVHTGEPIRTDEGYVGVDLHQGARLMAAAAGGQVAVSEATAAAVSNTGLDEALLIDLGEHALKDFSLPQRIFQLAGPGLEAAFPPLRTLSVRFVNIPTLGGPLVGRDDEVAAIVELFVDEGERLVTLTGPGGTGKTSLALRAGAELLERMTGGVVFCDLAPVADPSLLPAGIAAALGLREKGGVPTLDVIVSFIGQKQLLLILDNLEQLLDGVAVISKLLDACPQLAIIATSRAPLRLAREREQPVDPLTPEDALEVLAVRARRADPRFSLDGDLREQAIALCAQLDSLPLAIELAAARLRLFSLPELLARLDTRLPLLTGGRRDAPDRQRTLRATVDWSYELLDPGEQQSLARVAVFAGGFSAEAAEAVCDATVDEIGVLVEHSLIRRQDDRLTLLETIREYGVERLAERGEESGLRRRHADWFVDLAERSADALYGTQQVAWLDCLEAELDNVRAALVYLLDASDAEGALRLTSSLLIFWEARRAAEGRRMLEASLENRAGVEPHVLARGLFAIGQLTYFEGALTRAAAFLEEAARLSRETGDDPSLAVSLSRLSWIALDTGRTEDALRLAGEALAVLDRVTEPWAQAETLNYAGATIAECAEGSRGLQLLERSRSTYQAMGNDQRAGDVLNNLGWASMLEGDLVAAREYHRRNLEVARRIGDGLRLGLALGNLGVIETLAGDFESARPLMCESLISLRDRGERRSLPEAFIVAAAVLAGRGDVEGAGRLVGAIEAVNETDGRDLNPIERRILDEHILARVAPGRSDAFECARAEGRELTLTDAIARALEALGDEQDVQPQGSPPASS